MAYANINNPANFQLQSFGQKGFRLIDSSFTPVADEYYRAVYAIEDSVVDTVNLHGDDFTAKDLLQGQTLYGLFSSVVVAVGGKVIAYIA
jgi:hypothetical protein